MVKKFLIAAAIVLGLIVLWQTLTSPTPATAPDPSAASSLSSQQAKKTLSADDGKIFAEQLAQMKDVVIEDKEPAPAGAKVLAKSLFVKQGYDAKGTALLIEHDGEKTVRMEGFETVNAPSLHVYVSTDLLATDYLDLGAIRVTKGDANYILPPGVNTAKYRHVLLWSQGFEVLMSSATF